MLGSVRIQVMNINSNRSITNIRFIENNNTRFEKCRSSWYKKLWAILWYEVEQNKMWQPLHKLSLKDTLKAFDDLKKKATKVYEVMFFDM